MKENNERLTSRDLQAIERRAQLLDAAKELFAANGYHGTTTRQITKHIKMADGLIYHYFPNGKIEILETIIKEFTDDRYKLIEQEIEAVNESMSMGEVLEILGNLIFKYIGRDRNVILILLKEQNIISGELNQTFQKHMRNVVNMTVSILETRAQKKEIRTMDYYMMANQFWSAIYTYILQNILFGDNNLYPDQKDVYLKRIIGHTLLTWKI